MTEATRGAGQELPAGSEAERILDRLARILGESTRVSAVFGSPVERDGVTVIPVARAHWGVGAGAGAANRKASGVGGGGGLVIRPIGYIELKGGESRFRRIYGSWLPVVVGAGSLALWFLLRRSGRR